MPARAAIAVDSAITRGMAGLWMRGRADFLGVMWMERAEIRHSRLIAWLLDPLGRHGLGASVLRGVLKQCFPGADFEPIEDA